MQTIKRLLIEQNDEDQRNKKNQWFLKIKPVVMKIKNPIIKIKINIKKKIMKIINKMCKK